MKTLILINGDSYNATDESTIENVRIPVPTASRAKAIINKVKRLGMNNVTFNGKYYRQVEITSAVQSAEADGRYVEIRSQMPGEKSMAKEDIFARLEQKYEEMEK
jgi:maleate cis-trans isomerase